MPIDPAIIAISPDGLAVGVLAIVRLELKQLLVEGIVVMLMSDA